MFPRQLRELQSKKTFAYGRVRMYLDNTVHQFEYPYKSGEKKRIKITEKDSENTFIIEELEKCKTSLYSWLHWFSLIEENGFFYLVCK